MQRELTEKFAEEEYDSFKARHGSYRGSSPCSALLRPVVAHTRSSCPVRALLDLVCHAMVDQDRVRTMVELTDEVFTILFGPLSSPAALVGNALHALQ